MVASNFTLNDVSLCPKYREPFDIIAQGLSRPNWLPEATEAGHWKVSVCL